MKQTGLWLTILVMLFCAATATADNWPQFRGPDSNQLTKEKTLPQRWSEDENIRWKIDARGTGWSSPVVWGKQIWLTTGRADGSELFAICVHLDTGKIVHDIKVFDVANPQLEWPKLNSHATPTPIVEADRIYVHFGTYGTACLDTRTDKTLWARRDLNCDHRVRPASSPIIEGDSLFLHFDGVDTQFVAALDKHTGEELWVARLPASGMATPATYTGPKTGKQFVVIAAGGGNKYDKKFTGKLIAFSLP